MKKLLLLTLIATSFMQVKAQFTLSAEVNARGEYRNGFKKPILETQDPAFFIEQRTRIYAGFKSDELHTQITLQDIRFWGDDGIVDKSYSGSHGIADAWVRYFLAPKFSIKAGRQMISYDNQRMFGGLEWAMQGLRHDALLLMYEDTSGLKVDVGLAFNQQSSTAGEPVRLTGTYYPPFTGNGPYHATGNYKHMEYAYLQKKFSTGGFSTYLINDGRQYGLEDSVANRQTYGLMADKTLGGIKFNIEGFYQGGKIAATDLSAYMFAASATVKTGLTPITIGYDHLSGQEADADKITAFAPLFGTNHAFYGFMDYFYVGNGHKGGLQDIYAKTKFKIGKGALLGHLHYFLTAASVADGDGQTIDSGLGTELDLVYVRNLGQYGTFKMGYSQMFATSSMDSIKGISAATGGNNWAWAQLIFKPKFL